MKRSDKRILAGALSFGFLATMLSLVVTGPVDTAWAALWTYVMILVA